MGGVRHRWQSGLDRSLGLDDIFVLPGKTFRLTFVEDVDGDGLPGVLEWANRCKDSTKDSDGDTLDDRFETTRGWNVAPGLWGKTSTPTKAFSSCYDPDSDEDTVPDVREAPGVLTRNALGLIMNGTTPGVGPGTVTPNRTATLTGARTKFTTTFKVGDTIRVSGEGDRAIAEITSDTSLEVSEAFATSASGMVYFFTGSAPDRVALGTTTTVASESAMLALPAKPGDFAIRSDLDPDGTGPIQAPLFMLTGGSPATAANWVKAPTNDPTVTTDPVKRAMGDPVTNPAAKDTDGDGINDGDELKPRRVRLTFSPGGPDYPPDTSAPIVGPREATKCTVPLITSPEWKDSDGDSAWDGLEQFVGGDPTQSDRDNFADDDRDGLVNIQETTGWTVVVEKVSENPNWVVSGSDPAARQPCNSVCPAGPKVGGVLVKSDPKVKDSDGDGLNDSEEMKLGTSPTAADTDGDVLKDAQEVKGFSFAPFGTIVTDPFDADTDDDRRSDGEEANLSTKFIVRLEGDTPYEVASSPINADRDLDMLVDGEEFLSLTDPGKANTDGDPRSDYVEVDLGRNPSFPTWSSR